MIRIILIFLLLTIIECISNENYELPNSIDIYAVQWNTKAINGFRVHSIVDNFEVRQSNAVKVTIKDISFISNLIISLNECDEVTNKEGAYINVRVVCMINYPNHIDTLSFGRYRQDIFRKDDDFYKIDNKIEDLIYSELPNYFTFGKDNDYFEKNLKKVK